MTESEKLKALIEAIDEHHARVWGGGSVDHPDDAELYEKLDAIIERKPA